MPPYRTIPSNEEPKKFGHNMHVVLELTIGIALRSQRLHWTLPSLSTPVQCERWSDLMPLMTWQLWLAKDLVADYHLPWQKPQTLLTPERVAQSLFSLLIEIGSPAQPPKTRGKSPGWEKGKTRSKRKTYPTVKKRHSTPTKSATKAS